MNICNKDCDDNGAIQEAELNKPWVTETLKKEIIKKHKLYQTAREKKQDSDWQAFKEQRNLVAKITNTAKLEYIGSHPDAVSIIFMQFMIKIIEIILLCVPYLL